MARRRSISSQTAHSHIRHSRQLENRLRTQRRRLLHETLEKRELLTAEVIPHPVFAPETPDEIINRWETDLALSGGTDPILDGTRWENTALGQFPNRGDASSITWSIVPDGTDIDDGDTETTPSTSDLIAFLDGIYGGSGEAAVEDKPWFNIMVNMYDMWGKNTGLNLVYEPNDDGAPMGIGAQIGITGVRGDMRVGGHLIDGNSNVLAVNYLPNGNGLFGSDGDMIIDTGDNFYANNADGPGGENRGLTNVLAHETGHGIGLLHVEPINATKLMEPIVNFAFVGPQEDDYWNAHILYGDPSEPNDTFAEAVDLGAFRNTTRTFQGSSIDNGVTDVDLYKFSIDSLKSVSLVVNPTGTSYLEGLQPDPLPVPVPVLVDRSAEIDLGFRLLAADGVTVLAEVNDNPIGSPETLNDFGLTETGEFFVEVFGGTGEAQMYGLTVQTATDLDLGESLRSPRLIGVNPNAESLLNRIATNTLSVAPTEMTFRFSGGSKIDPTTLEQGIRITRAGNDGIFGPGAGGVVDDIVIEPGFLGFGDNQQIVNARFAETLPDDSYQIEVFGFDDPLSGITGIRNEAGDLLQPFTEGSDRDLFRFDLELGARVVSVVPQPVIRNDDGSLEQKNDQIHVYFDDSDLFEGGGTASLLDTDYYPLIRTNDSVGTGDDTVYYPNNVLITDEDATLQRVTLVYDNDLAALAGAGAYRLRIGSNAEVAETGTTRTPQMLFPTDPGPTTTSATPLGDITDKPAFLINQSIVDVGLPFDLPGGNDEPGHRDFSENVHLGGADSSGGMGIIPYSFPEIDTFDDDGNPIFNVINEEQKERFREIMDIYGELFGFDLIETEEDGASYVVSKNSPEQEGVNAASGGGGRVFFDAAVPWDNSYGGSFHGVLIHELGHHIGIGHTFDAVGSYMGGGAVVDGEIPGPQDIVHGKHLHRPDNRDVDFYRFTVPTGPSGTFTAETFAERLPDASQLDTYLTLYRSGPDGPELIAGNDDNFGKDSRLTLDLEPGDYFVGVTVQGNQDFNPLESNTGSGGASEGLYQLQLQFLPNLKGTSIEDAAGTPIDGDGDGTPGGQFDFWFRTADTATTGAQTLFVDATASVGGNGSITTPFSNIDTAINVASEGDIVRIVGNAGADGLYGTRSDGFAASSDNLAYEIGRVLGRSLDDGAHLQVPKGVTLMIDSGAILKMLGSSISVGSNTSGIDASGGAIQVLGTPQLPVFFTSYNDTQLGINSNPLSEPVRSGDWGGINILNGTDRAEGRREWERQGIFLNYIGQADIQYGGGLIPAIAPIRLDTIRPTLIGNTIRNNADAAISADPNSFEETTFTEPRYQFRESFVPDYDRIGPKIYSNHITENSVNGLLIRVDTLPGDSQEQLVVPGRFDDTEVVHILGDDLLLDGNPGGLILDPRPADLGLLSTTPIPSPTAPGLPAGEYSYALSYVDYAGNETIASNESVSQSITAGQAIQIDNLPQPSKASIGKFHEDFVSRRLYRSKDGGSLQLVAELNRTDSDFLDDRPVSEPISPIDIPLLRSRSDARLAIDPGVIIKSQGVRIEAGFGADLIAEGVEGHPVIFTSRGDDRYGAGGTFDTDKDGPSAGTPGDWGGIYMWPTGHLSIDHAVVTYAGGDSTDNGVAKTYNAITLDQAKARITNSLFDDNASGRNQTIIYAVAAQPTILDNTFQNNRLGSPSVISLNAGSFVNTPLNDHGRQTGGIGLVEPSVGNYGPLISGNRLHNNGLNGLLVRGQTVGTESIWDDTDIVHIVSSSVTSPNFHTYGGLRLQSGPDESLVVKFAAGASLIAGGTPLDINDRIGGRVQIIGSGDFPVILTSLHDDSVGAGFGLNGLPTLDTDGNGPTLGTPGDWEGVLLTEFSHDRNLETIIEQEGETEGRGDRNASPETAQKLGLLAANEKSGDENLRLGYTIYGAISAATDQDIYTFEGTAGTPVWFDIDQTDAGLNSVVELIDANGVVLATSNDSHAESEFGGLTTAPRIHANIMRLDPLHLDPLGATNQTYRDLYTTNPLDAGFRAILPGITGNRQDYFVRVKNANENSLGAYQLQVRLQELDETAGSAIRYADIRYAANGITTRGLPGHSPLAGEAIFGDDVVELGNLGATDRAAVSLSGLLDGKSTINEYSFSVKRTHVKRKKPNLDVLPPLEPTDMPLAPPAISFTFDIDYASLLSRPETSLWLYRQHDLPDPDNPQDPNQNNPDAGKWVLYASAHDSNIAFDQAAPLEGNDQEDLSRGSVGPGDPFLGTLSLTEGNYHLVVTTGLNQTDEYTQFDTRDTLQPNVRVEPNSSTRRISEDRFNLNEDRDDEIPNKPVPEEPGPLLPPVTVAFGGNENVVPYSLGDVVLFIASVAAGGTSEIHQHNALLGTEELILGQVDEGDQGQVAHLGSLATHPGGDIYAYGAPFGVVNDEAVNGFFQINDSGATGGLLSIGTSGIRTFEAHVASDTDPTVVIEQARTGTGTNPTSPAEGDGMVFSALSYRVTGSMDQFLNLYGVASRGNGETTYQSVLNPEPAEDDPLEIGPDVPATNYLYILNPTTGAVINANQNGDRVGNALAQGAGTDKIEVGRISEIDGAGNELITGIASGLAEMNGILYGVTDEGKLFSVDSVLDNLDPNPDPTMDQQIGNFIADVRDADGNQIAFSGLTTGPRNIQVGTEADGTPIMGDEVLVGIDNPPDSSASRVHAFRIIPDPLNPFQETHQLFPLFSRGQSSVDTGVFGATGLDFSNLDTNLWHLTKQRDGEGFTPLDHTFKSPDPEQLEMDETDPLYSLYFGWDDDIDIEREEDNLDPIWQESYSPAARSNENYDFAGGAHGSVESHVIDLSNYSANDLPTLYFDYFIDTEDFEIAPARDTFRVYAAGSRPAANGEPAWKLLASNREEDQMDQEEVDAELKSVDLYDVAEWRQARVSLADFAGDDNVRIRFEFDTAGESNLEAAELTAFPGWDLVDGDSFVLTSKDNSQTSRFTFSHGLLLSAPAGSSINDGDVLTITHNPGTGPVNTALVFGTDIAFTPTDSSATVADRIQAELASRGIDARIGGDTLLERTAGADNLERISIPTGISATAPTLPGGTVLTDPTVIGAADAVIPITVEMTATEVRDAIRVALAEEFNVAGAEDQLAPYTVFNDSIRLFGIVIDDPGPLRFLTGELVESGNAPTLHENDDGVFLDPDLDAPFRRGIENRGNGIFIDDVVIGFAERGEVVTGGIAHDVDTANPTPFIPNEILGADRINVKGEYLLEIRTSADYSQSVSNDAATGDPGADVQADYDRVFDTNAVNEKAISLTFPDGSLIADGDFLQFSDGFQEINLEFEDIDATPAATGVRRGFIPMEFDSTMSASQIANQVRDSINTREVREKIDLRASSSDGTFTAGTGNSDTILLHAVVSSGPTGGLDFSNNSLITTNVFGFDTFGATVHDTGDSNRFRDQGQIILQNNFIRHSQNFGIIVSAGDVGDLAHPGPTIPYVTQDASNLVPGVVVANNVIHGSRNGGIQVNGDLEGRASAPTPYARVINNTIYGENRRGTGIDVINASPTLLNNAVVNFDIGINNDRAVLLSNLYASNNRNATAGVGAFAIETDVEVFLNPESDNFYPAVQSALIDSAMGSVNDRESIASLRDHLGLGNSPIIAPQTDITGRIRTDDPSVNNTGGTGSTIFIDRGAYDRSDSVGPVARIANPLDNDSPMLDVNRDETYIRLVEGTLDHFAIQLLEPLGVGPDATSITSAAVILTENGNRLLPGQDYTFGYGSTSRTILLTPRSGIWRPDATYEITLNNRPRIAFRAPTGKEIADGDILTLKDDSGTDATFEFDTGYVLQIPQGLILNVPIGEGVAGGFVDGQTFAITSPATETNPTGATVTFEIATVNRNTGENVRVLIAPQATSQQVRDAILGALSSADAAALELSPTSLGDQQIQLGSIPGHSIDALTSPITVTGTDETILPGDKIIYRSDEQQVQIEFTNDGILDPRSDHGILLSPDPTDPRNSSDQLATRVAAAFRDLNIGLSTARNVGGGRVHLGGQVGDELTLESMAIIQSGNPGVTGPLELTVDLTANAARLEGQTFSLSVMNGPAKTFEFTTDGIVESPDNVLILLNPGDPGTPGDTANLIAQKMVTAIGIQFPGLLTPSANGNSLQLGEPLGTILDLTNVPLISTAGIPGGAIPVPVVPDESLDANIIAAQLSRTINQSGLVAQAFSPGDGLVLVERVEVIGEVPNVDLDPITDLAGNWLLANRANRETQFTIVMPEVELDFGDAPLDKITNQARHTLVDHRDLRFGPLVDSEENNPFPGSDDANGDDDEDGILVGTFGTINGVFLDSDNNLLGVLNRESPLGAELSVQVNHTGLLDAWIDFNQDGDWNDPGERVAASLPVLEGDNRLSITTPATASVGETWARFRLSDIGDVSPHGLVIGGEVEDHLVRVVSMALPVPDDDLYDMNEDQVGGLVIDAANGVLLDDALFGLQNPEVELDKNVRFGTLTLDTNGGFTYVPNSQFYGTDTFTYRILGEQRIDLADPASPFLSIRSSEVGTVTITIDPVNDLPLVQDHDFTTLEDIAGGFRITAAELLAGAASGDFLPTIPEPFNESVQTLKITGINDDPTILNGLADPPPRHPDGPKEDLTTTQGMKIVANFLEGALIDLVYFPTDHYNADNPKDAILDTFDSFTFTVYDDGATTLDDAERTLLDPPLRPAFSIGTAKIDVTPVNDQPIIPVTGPDAVDQNLTLLEDAPAFDELWVNATLRGPLAALDETAQTISYTITPNAGDFSRLFSAQPQIDVNGRLTFELNQNQNGSAIFAVVAVDSGANATANGDDAISDPVLLTITVQPVNDPPEFTLRKSNAVVLEDSGAMRLNDFAFNIAAGPADSALDETDLTSGQNASFTLTVSDSADQPFADQLFIQPPRITTTGTLVFEAAADEFGTLVFDVVLTDNGPNDPLRGDVASSATEKLTITVQPQNDAPRFATDDPVDFTLNEDASVLIPLVALADQPIGLLDKFIVGPGNEEGGLVPGGNQTLKLVDPIPTSTISGGQLTQVTIDGRSFLRYTPKEHFNGNDSFVYGVTDVDAISIDLDGNQTADPKSAFFSVNLIVLPINDAPQFGDATDVTVSEDAGEDDLTVPAEDIGFTVIPSWLTNIQAGPVGAVDEIATPPLGQTVQFDVVPNDPAVASNLFVTDEGVLQVTVDLDGTLRIRTLPNATGITSFTVQARDNGNAIPEHPDDNNTSISKIFTVTIGEVNDPPLFTAGGNVTVDEDNGPYVENWASNILAGPANEQSNQTVRFEVDTPVSDRALFQVLPEISDDGILRFTPAPNQHGSADLIVRAIDSLGGVSEDSTFTITITPQPDVPTAGDDSFETDEDTKITISRLDILENDPDADLPADSLTIVLDSSTSLSGATLSLDTDGNVIYDPTNADALQALAPNTSPLTDTFTYHVLDSSGRTSASATIQMTVAGVNDPVRVSPDFPDVQFGEETVLRPLDNDVDIDGTVDISSIVVTLPPAFGTFETTVDGTIVYKPFGSFRGQDLLRYTVADNLGARSAEQTISINTNTLPIASGDGIVVTRDSSVDINVLDNDTDPDGTLAIHSIQISRSPSHGEAIPLSDGSIRYVPDENGVVGNDSFEYTVSDNLGGQSNSAEVTIRIVGSSLENPQDNNDVNDDGFISPIDALLIINYLNRKAPTEVAPDAQGPNYYDVDGNKHIQPLDALRVINVLNRRSRQSSFQGESVPQIEPRTSEPTTTPSDTSNRLSTDPVDKLIGTETAQSVDPISEDEVLDVLAHDRVDTTEKALAGPIDEVWEQYQKLG